MPHIVLLDSGGALYNLTRTDYISEVWLNGS
jgi:hypothetical protein